MLATGLAFGEWPRWHDGRLWAADWMAQDLLTVAGDGATNVMARVPSFPFSIDWRPDGTLMVVSGSDRALQRLDVGGGLTTVADLRPLRDRPWNEIVVDGRGNTYVNCIGFDLMGGEDPAPGIIPWSRRTAGPVRWPTA